MAYEPCSQHTASTLSTPLCCKRRLPKPAVRPLSSSGRTWASRSLPPRHACGVLPHSPPSLRPLPVEGAKKWTLSESARGPPGSTLAPPLPPRRPPRGGLISSWVSFFCAFLLTLCVQLRSKRNAPSARAKVKDGQRSRQSTERTKFRQELRPKHPVTRELVQHLKSRAPSAGAHQGNARRVKTGATVSKSTLPGKAQAHSEPNARRDVHTKWPFVVRCRSPAGQTGFLLLVLLPTSAFSSTPHSSHLMSLFFKNRAICYPCLFFSFFFLNLRILPQNPSL